MIPQPALDAFLADLAALSLKHGLAIVGTYDGAEIMPAHACGKYSAYAGAGEVYLSWDECSEKDRGSLAAQVQSPGPEDGNPSQGSNS